MKKGAGILLSITSLPSKYGIGCFSESAYHFIDQLKRAGQHYWQILPLGQTGYGDSPYQSFSTFAGNPYFIDLDRFAALDPSLREKCEAADWGGNASYVDYEKIYQNRMKLLYEAYKLFDLTHEADFDAFCVENAAWLEDYSLFMAIKKSLGGISWDQWEEDIRLRLPSALASYRARLQDEIRFEKFLQYHFFKQWHELKAYANAKDIEIIGDIPIYVAFDSADTWSNPSLFQLDDKNVPLAVAGCPPDGFSADGQLWGNPLYRWDVHQKEGYAWWISRLRKCFELYDIVRVDHFRGFASYYSIPFGDQTAKNGHWEAGPAMDLFSAVKAALGTKRIIAEDLGYVTDEVRELVKDSGFPNMKVLEFAFDSRDTGSAGDYLPHNYGENCVAYTGTHDNQTVISWFNTVSDKERAMTRAYLCDQATPSEKLHLPLIALLMRSNAFATIIPMQDWLGLTDEARMNQPSTSGNNWKWRLTEGQFDEALEKTIYEMTKIYGRIME